MQTSNSCADYFQRLKGSIGNERAIYANSDVHVKAFDKLLRDIDLFLEFLDSENLDLAKCCNDEVLLEQNARSIFVAMSKVTR